MSVVRSVGSRSSLTARPCYRFSIVRRTFLTWTALTAATSSLGLACSFVAWEEFTSNATIVKTDAGDAAADPTSDGMASPSTQTLDGGDYASLVLADKPAAYFRFEEEPGALLANDVGGRYVARATEKPGFGLQGIVGRAVALTKQPGLDVGDVFDFGGKVPFALEAWIKLPTRSYDQIVFHKRGGDPMQGYIVYVGTDRSVHFEAWGVGLSAWTTTPMSQDFSHIVVSVSYATGKGNTTLWVNGQRGPNGAFDNEGDMPETNEPLIIGRDVDGLVDEVVIYEHELAESSVLTHYLAGLDARR
jgi:hypothetical protein